MRITPIIHVVAAVLTVSVGPIIKADKGFKVVRVFWADGGLRVEIKSHLPDGSEVNLCITDDIDGFNCISTAKYFTVNRGGFLIAYAADANDEPFRPGRYWVSIAKGMDDLPRVAVLAITIPERTSKD
jgi:hypothetical protein